MTVGVLPLFSNCYYDYHDVDGDYHYYAQTHK